MSVDENFISGVTKPRRVIRDRHNSVQSPHGKVPAAYLAPSAEEVAKARLCVASNAKDIADGKLLLEALGLLPSQLKKES
jgi:hypothetical protein